MSGPTSYVVSALFLRRALPLPRPAASLPRLRSVAQLRPIAPASAQVRYLYADADVASVSVRVKEAARRARAATAAAAQGATPGTPRASAAARARAFESAGKVTPHRLPYAAFVQELLEFQLSGHLTYAPNGEAHAPARARRSRG